MKGCNGCYGCCCWSYETRHAVTAACIDRASDEGADDNGDAFNGPNMFIPLGAEDGVVLYQVKIIFRHGVRPPLNIASGISEVSYPVSLDNDIPDIRYPFRVVRHPDGAPVGVAFEEIGLRKFRLKGGCPQTILTTVGQRQMVNFGKKIMRSYIGPLGIKAYSPHQVRIRSSHLDRSIKSLRCMLAGIFGREQMAAVGVLHIPVKHVWTEDLYPNKLACTALRTMFRQQIGYYESIPGLKEDQRTLKKALDMSKGVPVDFLCLKDDISSRMAHGYECPATLVPFQDMIKHNAGRIFHFFLTGQFGPEPETSEMLRLSVGTFLYTLVSSMTTESPRRCPKLDLYSAHDTTVGCLMKALDIWSDEMPPFAASITFEMYRSSKENDKIFVRTLYCGNAVPIGKNKTYLVPLSEFVQSVQRYTTSPEEHREACDRNSLASGSSFSTDQKSSKRLLGNRT